MDTCLPAEGSGLSAVRLKLCPVSPAALLCRWENGLVCLVSSWKMNMQNPENLFCIPNPNQKKISVIANYIQANGRNGAN